MIGQCKSASAKQDPHVWIFKQWHLDPSVVTKNKVSVRGVPQRENQTSIYKQLEEWVKSGVLDEVYAEGCSGELTAESNLSFNGWSMADLKAAAARPDYAEIVSHVPMKIEAKFGAIVRTLCGDDAKLIQKNALAFSDARGALGFLTRLQQHQNHPRRAKPYLDGVIELYQLPAQTDLKVAIARLKTELKSSVKRAQDYIEKRNALLVAQIKRSKKKQVAVVFGGAHTQGIVRLLEKAGIACSVVEPTGYQDKEAALLQKLNDSINDL